MSEHRPAPDPEDQEEEEEREQEQPEREVPGSRSDHPDDLASFGSLREAVRDTRVVRRDPDADSQQEHQHERHDPETPSHLVLLSTEPSTAIVASRCEGVVNDSRRVRVPHMRPATGLGSTPMRRSPALVALAMLLTACGGIIDTSGKPTTSCHDVIPECHLHRLPPQPPPPHQPHPPLP